MKWLKDLPDMVLIALMVVCVFGFIVTLPPIAHAAPPAVPDWCDMVASIGTIDTYYCQPDNGPNFLTNSVGFIALEQ